MAMAPPKADARLLGPGLAAVAGAYVGLRIAATPGAGLAFALMSVAACLAGAFAWRQAEGTGLTGAAAIVLTLTAAGAAAGAGAIAHAWATAPAPIVSLAQEGKEARIEGTVASRARPIKGFEEGQCRVDITVRAVAARGGQSLWSARASGGGQIRPPASVRIRLWRAPCTLLEGQKVQATGRLKASQAGVRHCAEMSPSKLTAAGAPSAVASKVAAIDHALSAVLATSPPHAQGLIPGVALGDDSRVGEDLAEAMKMTQLTHLIAVSGGHVAIAVGLVLSLLGRRRPILSAGLSALALAGLIALVGPEASVVRAAIMGAVTLAGLALRRPAQATGALALCLLAASLADPWLAVSYGFLLSAAATAGIVLLGQPLAAHVARSLEAGTPARLAMPARLRAPLAQMAAIPLAAQISCTPILLLFTDEGSIWGVAANALVAPTAAPLTILGLGAALAAPAWPGLSALLVALAQLLTWWIDAVARTLASWPGSGIPLRQAGILSLAMLGGLLLLDRGRAALAFAAAAIVVLAAVLLPGPARTRIPPDWDAIQCDVGQGSALLARAAGATILVDVGPEGGGIGACLKAAGVRRVDLLVLSHYHDDHVGGLREALEAVTVAEAWTSPNTEPRQASLAADRLLADNGVPCVRARAGTGYRTQAGLAVSVVSPGVHPTGDPNEDSLVVRIGTSGGLLVLSDADGEVQNAIAAQIEPVHALVVAHHGSARQKGRLARAAAPDIALISVGENDYGHPSREALEAYAQADIYDTLHCGSIALRGQEVISQCEQPAPSPGSPR